MLNLKKRIAEARQNDEGFTLIELAVVILIIGILLALALPSFLGVRKNAQDKAAQATNKIALTNAKGLYGDQQDYSGVSVASLGAAEPGTTYAAAASIDSKHPSFVVGGTSNQAFAVATLSKGGLCFMIQDDSSPGAVHPGTTTWKKTANTTTNDCVATVADPAAATPVWTQITAAA
jgi:type IV pilus assembly protein PilA